VAALLASMLVQAGAQAQDFSTLHAFSGRDGSSPSATLVPGPDGNLYGTTQLGGENGFGTVYAVSPTGEMTVLYSLSGAEGADVFSPLVFGRDKQFYGTTALGGAGVLNGRGAIFRFSLAGEYTPLYFFSGRDGEKPESGLAQASDGWLYGTTTSGGDSGKGSVFAISLDGEFRSLHAFSGSDGDMPLGELLPDDDGWLYGTTVNGGAHNGGTVFRVSPSGELSVLHDFSFDAPDGNSPRGGLVRGLDGAYYGTLAFGGDHGAGAVFRLMPGGNLTTVHAFSQDDGSTPLASLILGCDGKLYGTTSSGGACNAGTVFVVAPTGELSVLHAFTGRDDGGSPVSGLMQASDCSLYGTTPVGGTWLRGTVYRITPAGPAQPGSAGGDQTVGDGLTASGSDGTGGLTSGSGGPGVDGGAALPPGDGNAGTGGSGGATGAVAGNSGSAPGNLGGSSGQASSGEVQPTPGRVSLNYGKAGCACSLGDRGASESLGTLALALSMLGMVVMRRRIARRCDF
jgi:MYXO-CTERM domain-containing protein